MAAKRKPTPEAEPPGDPLDSQLRAWFDGMLAQPAPEALLRHLDDLAAPEPDQASSA